MNDKPKPIRRDLRTLTSYELQTRNLLAIEPHLRRVLDDLEGSHTELVHQLQQQLAFCDLENTLDTLTRLRNALESEA